MANIVQPVGAGARFIQLRSLNHAPIFNAMAAPAMNLSDEERAALERARANMAFEGYPTTDEQAAAVVAFVRENGLVEKAAEAMKLPVEEALEAIHRMWETARTAQPGDSRAV